MDEKPVSPEPAPADYDIFLCTRELPDALTAETAALRQLCSALIGSGYRVFFPSALPAGLTDEQRAQRIVEALSGSKVMIAAGVGSESASDPVSEKLRSAFLKRAEADPSLGFIACWRDAAGGDLPADLADRELLNILLSPRRRKSPNRQSRIPIPGRAIPGRTVRRMPRQSLRPPPRRRGKNRSPGYGSS